MGLFSDYSKLIVYSFLKLQEGDALSINTEETDFEFAKVIADMAVRVTKTVAKIVITEKGKPSEVVDFDSYEPPVQASTFCMLHLSHVDSILSEEENTLDIIVDKDDLSTVHKIGHLADPIIIDRRIAIPWCVVPAFNVNDERLETLIRKFSIDFEGQILSTKYRIKFLNHADIDKFHFYSNKCDFTVDIPENSQFTGGPSLLSSGREFVSGVDFQNIIINVDKNSLNGWFDAETTIFGKKCTVRFEYVDGKLSKVSDCSNLNRLLSFDYQLTKPGYIAINDKEFSIVFGSSLVDSMVSMPDDIENLPEWFNDCIYKYICKLDEKLNLEYIGCDNISHELVRKGFFLE